jgi:hypothetical protein
MHTTPCRGHTGASAPGQARQHIPQHTARGLLAAAALMLSACSQAAPAASALPLSATPFPASQHLLVWVGTGQASVFESGAWKRVPQHDYEFSVTQRRYADRWESVKVQHRRHPDYDGTAGARDQTNYFKTELPAAGPATELKFTLRSSFGDGAGHIDSSFRAAAMEFDARDVSMFAPFNRYRITQQYRYEQGELVEVVELFKRKGDSEAAFMRFEERAAMLAPHRFDSAPDRR